MDWSGALGYAGLYENVNKRESAKQDLATLSVLSQEVKQQKKEQEEAQLKEQAYYDQISKFADTLLAPDRARVNEKSKGMAQMVRNHLKQYGGDISKFWANGGHKIIGDYKNSIINSDESSIYLENKKNMERILDMQSKGFGHLLNSTDSFNLKQYEATGKGRITYTGMLSELKMPDPNSEIWGKEITADRILHNEGNYMKVYTNYKIEFPNAGEPTQQDLLQYVAARHSDMLGTNWQKPMQERSQAFQEFDSSRKFEHDVYSDNRDFKFREYQQQMQNYQWEKGFQLEADAQDFNQQLQMLELEYANNGGARKSSSSSTGYMNAQGDPISKEDYAATNNFMSDMENVNAIMNSEINSIDKITSTTSDVYKSILGEDTLLDNNYSYYDRSGNGGGSMINTVFDRQYKPRGSKIIFTGQVAETALKNTGLFKMDADGNIKNLNLEQNPDLFSANGVRIKDWSAGSLKPKEGFFYDNYAQQISGTTFKVKGIVTGVVGKDNQNNDVLITDVTKVGDNGKTVISESKTKEWNKNYKAGNKQFNHKMLVAIENEKGQVFYKPIDGNVEKTMLSTFAGMNVGGIKRGKAVASQMAQQRMDKKGQAVRIYKDLLKDGSSMSQIRQQVQIVSQNPNSNKFDDAAISFYTHLKNQYEINGKNVKLNQLVKNGTFYQMLQSATDTPEEKQRLNRLLQNPKARSYDFAKFIIDNTDYEGGQDWLETLKFAQSAK